MQTDYVRLESSFAGANSLELRLFGEFRLRDAADGTDHTPRGRKARALIAYLALTEGGVAARGRLAGLLWSDRGEAQASASLRQTLSELRAGVLGRLDAIDARRDAVRLNMPLESDLTRFEAAAASGDVAGLGQILCDVGVLLQDLDGLSPLFDEWLQSERARRQDAVMAAAIEAVASASDRADPAHLRAVIGAIERLDPGNEPAARLGMQVDHAASDLASLHRRYRRLTDQLRREFAAEPSLETRTLFERLTSIVPGGSEPQRAMRPALAAPTEPPTVIVSPFVAIDSAGSNATLAAICTDDIRTALARHRDLRVISTEGADTARIEAVCAGSVASYLLSGSLRQDGDRLRVNVKLSGAGSGVILWSEQIDLADAQLGQAVDKIVDRAVGAAWPVIARDVGHRLPAEDDAAVVLYMRACALTRTARDPGSLKLAASLLEQAIARDSRHGNARLLLARLYNTGFFETMAGHDPAPMLARALVLAREAAMLDPENAAAHRRLGWCHLRRSEWGAAEQAFERAVDLCRLDADTLNEAGFGLCLAGELDRARLLIDRAFTINPFPPAEYHSDLAVVLTLAGDLQPGEEHFEVSSDPGLHYLAVRIAGLARLDPDAPRVSELATDLRERFGAIWSATPPASPTDPQLLEWIGRYLPLRRDEHRRFVQENLSMALARSARESEHDRR